MREIVLHRASARDHVALLGEGPFADRLRDDGVGVSVCPFSARGADIQKDTGLLKKLGSLWDVRRVAGKLRFLAKSYDVVYANTAKALVVASLARGFSRKPLVYHLHDILSPEHFSTSNRRLLVTLANRASAVIANSNATADAFVDSGGRREIVSVIANGIDFKPFDDAVAASTLHREPIRAALKVGSSSLVGLFGRLAPWKGQHLGIRAIAEFPETHLALVGDALFGESRYATELRNQVKGAGLEDRVHFLGFRDDVAGLMQACDVVLHASVAAEPFGRVIAEAMVSGRPVVVANGGGAAEIVRDGETGWLYKPGDEREMRAAIVRALDQSNETVLERAASEARLRYCQWDRADDISRIIAGVVE